jgi:hypothetical protein
MRYLKIIIMGTGGIGFWLAWILCREFGKRGVTIDLYDPDNLEGGTGATRITGTPRTKIFKVDLCTMQIRNIMRDTVPNAYARKFTPDDLALYGDPAHTILIDTSDGPMNERREIWDRARAMGITIVRGSYEGRTEQEGGVVVVADSLPFQKSGNNAGGYASRPTIAASFLAAGLMGETINELMESGVLKGIRVEIPVTPKIVEVAHGVGE